MPGMYTVEMLAIKHGANTHNVRQASQAVGLNIDLNDMVDADEAEKKDAQLKKFLAEQQKEWLDSKKAGASHDDEKAKWLAEHNAKVAKQLENGWEAAVAAASSE